MKKQAVLLLVPVFAALSMLFSCDPKVDPVVNNDLSVSPESVSFDAEDKGHKLIMVTTAGD